MHALPHYEWPVNRDDLLHLLSEGSAMAVHLGLFLCLSACNSKTIAPFDLICLYKKEYTHGLVLL